MSILLMSARWKLTLDPWYVQEWGRLGWMQEALPLIGIIQLACVVLYHYFVRLIVVWLGPAERRGLYFFGEFCTLRG